MPHPPVFKAAFDVPRGKEISNYVIQKIECGHDAIVPMRHYEFPIVMHIYEIRHSKLADAELGAVVAKVISEHVKGSRETWSEYGNPYDCEFGDVKFQEVQRDKEGIRYVVLESHGVAIRNFDRPKQNSVEGTNREFAYPFTPEELLYHIEALRVWGARIVASRFNTAKCPTCGEQILSGDKIAQPKGVSKGGWVHVQCIAPPKLSDAEKLQVQEACEQAKSKKKRSKSAQTVKEEKQVGNNSPDSSRALAGIRSKATELPRQTKKRAESKVSEQDIKAASSPPALKRRSSRGPEPDKPLKRPRLASATKQKAKRVRDQSSESQTMVSRRDGGSEEAPRKRARK